MHMKFNRPSISSLVIVLSVLFLILLVLTSSIIGQSCKCNKSEDKTDVAASSISKEVGDLTSSSEAGEEKRITDSSVDQDYSSDTNVYTELFFMECSDRNEIPSFYTRIDPVGVDVPVYAFTDENGEVQYRVYGMKTYNKVNKTEQKEARGFVSVEIVPAADGFALKAKNDTFIRMYDERPGRVSAVMPNYGSIPKGVSQYKGIVFRYSTGNESIYCVYGSFDGIEFHYWESDETGVMILGSLYINI